MLSSTNGSTWTRHDASVTYSFAGVTWDGNRYVAFTASGQTIAESTDGKTWKSGTSADPPAGIEQADVVGPAEVLRQAESFIHIGRNDPPPSTSPLLLRRIQGQKPAMPRLPGFFGNISRPFDLMRVTMRGKAMLTEARKWSAPVFCVDFFRPQLARRFMIDDNADDRGRIPGLHLA
ncbi:hypothetical protein ACFQ7O_31840 [Streptomyces sp. NPDC056485]|uniref:hypothetical protein n=1 Tax=Streptomyces sp. NPDC056485 TaxID=3345834 RepID=UPI00367372DF